MPKISMFKLDVPSSCEDLTKTFLKNLKEMAERDGKGAAFYGLGVFSLGLTLRAQTPETLASISNTDLRDFIVTVMAFVCDVDDEDEAKSGHADNCDCAIDKKDLN